MAAQYGLEVLGQLPLDLAIRQDADHGLPTVAATPDGEVAAIYKAIARRVAVRVAEKARDFSAKLPKIVIQQN